MVLPEEIDAMVRGHRPLPGYDRHMGFQVASWDGCATLTVDVDERFCNPNGVLHGGLLMGLMDSAMGLSVLGRLPAGKAASNVETHNRFLRATTHGTLTAKAHVVKEGRQVVVMGCAVQDPLGREVAVASSTFLVTDGPDVASDAPPRPGTGAAASDLS